MVKRAPSMKAPAPYAVFKRWDRLEASDAPAVAVFFAEPDVLSALFTLANFDEPDLNAVISPQGAACATIARWPYVENEAERPRAVIGGFDISARPFIPRDRLTFAAPFRKLARMIGNMEESFLTTETWRRVKSRTESG